MGYFLDSTAPSMSINVEIRKLTVGYGRYMVTGSLEGQCNGQDELEPYEEWILMRFLQ